MEKTLLAAAFALFCLGCGSGSTNTSSTNVTVSVRAKADFDTSVSPILSRAINLVKEAKLTTCPDPAPSLDDPQYATGLDCDGDSGAINFVTPTTFKVAIKKLTFIKDDDTTVDIIPDTGTLTASEVYNLTSEITISPTDLSLSAGTYPTVEGEIYYYEITMEINSEDNIQTIRVYLSDDDFLSEEGVGLGHHHQGDITLIDSDGTELGFVMEDSLWNADNLAAERGNINGAGLTDAETQHKRGLFGNTDLWNQENFNQGTSQDIYTFSEPLNLEITDASEAVLITFDVKDSWFYEDFDTTAPENAIFNPCVNGNQDGCGGEWAPIFNLPNITFP